MQKGQVTLFIILGIILLAVIVLGLTLSQAFLKDSETGELITSKLQQEAGQVREIVESCMENELLEAADIILNRGGFLYLEDEESIDVFAIKTPYYYNYGAEKLPTEPRVEDAMEEFMEVTVPQCIVGFDEVQGFEVKEEANLDIDVTINQDGIVAEADYPLKISKGNVSESLESFETLVEIEARKVLESGLGLYRFIITENPSEIEIIEFIEDKEYSLAMEDLGDTRMFALRFDDVVINQNILVFPFAIKREIREINSENADSEGLRLLLELSELFSIDEPVPESLESATLEEEAANMEDVAGGVF